MITPAFHFNILQDFLEVMNTQTTFMSNKILQEVRNGKCQAVNMYSYITLCALDIICETAMGKSVSAQMSEEDSDYSQKVCNLMRTVFNTLNPKDPLNPNGQILSTLNLTKIFI